MHLIRISIPMRLKLLCTLTVCLFATALAAQDLPIAAPPTDVSVPPALLAASIHGTVTDVNNDAIPNASIVFTGPIVTGSEARPAAVSDANGFFQLNNLVAGTYHVTVSATGFADWTSEAIVLAPAQNLDLPGISLQLATAMTTVNATSYTQHEMAVQQVKIEETQRVLGFIPNYYAVYLPDPAPLSPKLKFELAWKTFLDPTTLLGTAFFAGIEQAGDSYPAYHQGAQGYGKRFGALYADNFTNNFFTGAIYPSLLHQDPRYYYKGTGTIRSRILYAIAMTVVCKGDNGHWQANYSAILGTFTSGAISNAYYPAAQRGVALTIDNGLINIASGAIGALMQEFVLKRFTPAARKQ
jgi:hypothetical protein